MKTFRDTYPLTTIRNKITGDQLAVLAFIDDSLLFAQRTIVVSNCSDWLKRDGTRLVGFEPRELKQGDLLKRDTSKQESDFCVEAVAFDADGFVHSVVVAQKFVLTDPENWSRN